MPATNHELTTMLLENVKMHAQTRLAVKQLKIRIGILEEQVMMKDPLPASAEPIWSELKADVDKSMDDLDTRFSALLSAMESFVNG